MLGRSPYWWSDAAQVREIEGVGKLHRAALSQNRVVGSIMQDEFGKLSYKPIFKPLRSSLSKRQRRRRFETLYLDHWATRNIWFYHFFLVTYFFRFWKRHSHGNYVRFFHTWNPKVYFSNYNATALAQCMFFTYLCMFIYAFLFFFWNHSINKNIFFYLYINDNTNVYIDIHLYFHLVFFKI